MGLSGPLPEHLLQCMDPKDRVQLGKAALTAKEATAVGQKRLEREEQRLFARELVRRDLPFYWHRTDKPTGATAGVPDFIVGIAGVTLWIEFKAQGSLSLTQEQFCTRLQTQRIPFFICWNAAKAIALLKTYEK